METEISIIGNNETKLSSDNILKCSCRYWCVLCDYQTIHSSSIIRHMSSKRHQNNNFKASSQNLKQREPLEREDKEACLKCTNQFRVTNKFNRYLSVTIPKSKPQAKNFRCHFCEYKGETFRKLDEHMRTHTGEKPYRCSHCNFEAARSHTLQYHINEKHNHVKYPCRDCSFIAKRYSQLRDHRDMKHTGGFKYVCALCGHKSKRSSGFSNHKRIHEKNNPFECDECKVQCYDSSGLINHQRIHSGDKPFKCEQCNVSFAQKGNLKTHRIAIHENKKAFACTWEECNYRANLRAHLIQHIATHSDGSPVHAQGKIDGKKTSRKKAHEETTNYFSLKRCDYK